MHDLTFKQGPPHCRATLRNDWLSCQVLRVVVGEAVRCNTLVHAVPLPGDITLISLAQPGGSLD